MNRIFTLALKDVKLLSRDKAALFWVLGFPLLIAVLFGAVFGGSNGTSRISVSLVDLDQTETSRSLMQKLQSSTALKPEVLEGADAVVRAREAVRKGKVSAYVVIPKGYAREVQTFRYTDGPGLVLGMDPGRKAEAGMLEGVVAKSAYQMLSVAMSPQSSTDLQKRVASIRNSPDMSPSEKDATLRLVQDASTYFAVAKSSPSKSAAPFQGPKIDQEAVIASGNEPSTPFEVTFPQAILWGLIGVISSFVTSLVREREQGTLARLRAAPLTLETILAGKATACLITSTFAMAALLAVGHFVFGVRLPSPMLAVAAILCSAVSIVGIMMLLSVLGRTDQSVSGASWGVMIMLAMFGGGMIPIFIMPGWMQTASNFSPLKWTTAAMEGAIWRGYSAQEMLLPCGVLVGVGTFCFLLGAAIFRARV